MRRLITLATLSVVLVTCVLAWAWTEREKRQVEAAKRKAMIKSFKERDPQGWEAARLKARAQVEARILEEQAQVEAAKHEGMVKKLIMKIDPRGWEPGLLEAQAKFKNGK